MSWFVTGTDTGVGKTRACVALLRALRAQSRRCVGMKPVSAGGDEDVLALRGASSVVVPNELDQPYALSDPVSPHIAAARDGVTIDILALRERFIALRERADAVIVEGAGGFCVPLTEAQTGADLAAALQLPVILVVGLRLGCLNHALLTQEAIAARHLRLVGWIANRVDPDMREADANVDFLRRRLSAPLLAAWPWQPARFTLDQLPDA